MLSLILYLVCGSSMTLYQSVESENRQCQTDDFCTSGQILDPASDNFEAIRIRTPFCFNSILSVAVRYKTTGAPSPQVYRACIDEAQGIGRSTLYAFVRGQVVIQDPI